MDLIAVMNERLRYQSSEMRSALLRWIIFTVLATVSITETVLSYRRNLQNSPTCTITARSEDDSCSAFPLATVLWRTFWWAVGNASLIWAMKSLLNVQSRTLSSSGRSSRLWPFSLHDSIETPTGGNQLARLFLNPSIMLTSYMVVTVINTLVVITASLGFVWFALMLLTQLSLFANRSYTWWSSVS